MRINRDDSSEQVKNILKDRVGGFCSNPLCRVPTIGPHTEQDKRTSIGIAAHITAAAPGGPRYNALLTPEQRAEHWYLTLLRNYYKWIGCIRRNL